jgi:hypothetical protein
MQQVGEPAFLALDSSAVTNVSCMHTHMSVRFGLTFHNAEMLELGVLWVSDKQG